MNIAVFTDNFLPGIGGTENAVLNYATELCKTDRVAVFAPDYKGVLTDGYDERFPFKVIRCKSHRLTKNDFLACPKSDKNFKAALNAFKPDIVHCQTLAPISNFAAAYAKKHGLPLVFTAHTKYMFCYRNSLKSKMLANLAVRVISKGIKRADAVCTVSRDMANELRAYGVNGDVTVIKNGGVARDNRFTKPETVAPRFLYVGLVIKYKNVGFTLNALSRVKKSGIPDFTFNVVGTGPHVKHFKKRAAKLGIGENVNFIGKITDAASLDKFYAESDLMLFPSVFDSDGLVVCEAGNMGTPSLTLEGTGASERITDGVNGFTAPNSVEEYAAKIVSVMSDRQNLRRVGENAKNLFTDWSANVAQYKKIYTELLKKD